MTGGVQFHLGFEVGGRGIETFRTQTELFLIFWLLTLITNVPIFALNNYCCLYFIISSEPEWNPAC